MRPTHFTTCQSYQFPQGLTMIKQFIPKNTRLGILTVSISFSKRWSARWSNSWAEQTGSSQSHHYSQKKFSKWSHRKPYLHDCLYLCFVHTEDEPLPMGHYLESHSQLKIRVEVSYPLTSSQEVKLKEEMETPPEVSVIFCFKFFFFSIATKLNVSTSYEIWRMC